MHDLCELAQGTPLSRLYNWGLNLYLFTSTTFIVFTLFWVNSEVPDWQTRKFWVHPLSWPNPEVPNLQTRKFWVWQIVNLIRCVWVKIYRCTYSPPLGDIKVLSPCGEYSRKLPCILPTLLNLVFSPSLQNTLCYCSLLSSVIVTSHNFCVIFICAKMRFLKNFVWSVNR